MLLLSSHRERSVLVRCAPQSTVHSQMRLKVPQDQRIELLPSCAVGITDGLADVEKCGLDLLASAESAELCRIEAGADVYTWVTQLPESLALTCGTV